jgi:hypothetical protein
MSLSNEVLCACRICHVRAAHFAPFQLVNYGGVDRKRSRTKTPFDYIVKKDSCTKKIDQPLTHTRVSPYI